MNLDTACSLNVFYCNFTYACVQLGPATGSHNSYSLFTGNPKGDFGKQ